MAWQGGVHRVLAEGLRRLPGELDAGRMEDGPAGGGAECVPEPAPPTVGARIAAGVQWVGLVAVVVGSAGAVSALTGVPVVRWFGVPGPSWVVFAGLVAVGVGAWFGRREARAAAVRRVDEVGAALRGRVRDAADRLLVGPAEAELDRYREAHGCFVAAREGPGGSEGVGWGGGAG